MSNRSAVATLILVLCLAGCLGGVTGTDTVTKKAYPDRPPIMTEATAGPYVAAYEEVYRHNRIVGQEIETIQEIVVGAGVVSVPERDDGWVVVVRVGFYWTFGDDGSGQSTGIADGRPYEATYFVNGTRTERLNNTLDIEPDVTGRSPGPARDHARVNEVGELGPFDVGVPTDSAPRRRT